MNNDSVVYTLAQCAQQDAVRKHKARQKAALRKTPRQRRATDTLQVSPSQRVGRNAEEQAARYITQAGLRLLGQNWRCKAGEIDLIATDGRTLIFIEVRQRQSHRFGGAAASVNRGKQRRLAHAALYFLPRLAKQHFGGLLPPCRFDVICVEPSGLVWIKQAFSGS